MAVVRADYESVRPTGKRSLSRVSWSVNPTIIDSLPAAISYSFWSRLFHRGEVKKVLQVGEKLLFIMRGS